MDVIDMYVGGKSIPMISKETGMPLSTIRFRLKKAGVLRSISESLRMAGAEGRLSHAKGSKRVFSKQWKENISKAQLTRHAITAVGVSIKPSGYVEHTRGEHKGRGVHVVLMEKHIGRRLFANEVVHHNDGNRSNNDLDNLQLMTRSEHASLHAKENLPNRKRKQNGVFE